MPETIQIGSMELRFLRDKHETGGSLDVFEMSCPPKDGVPIEVRSGDHVFIPRGIVHGFNNLSDEPAVCLSILTPGVLGPEYFRELGALVAGGAPDPAALKALVDTYGLIAVGDE